MNLGRLRLGFPDLPIACSGTDVLDVIIDVKAEPGEQPVWDKSALDFQKPNCPSASIMLVRSRERWDLFFFLSLS